MVVIVKGKPPLGNDAAGRPVLLDVMKKRIAQEVASRRVRVNAVAPDASSNACLPMPSAGFRGPLGTIGETRNSLLEARLIDRVDAILPMPDAPAMLALLERLSA